MKQPQKNHLCRTQWILLTLFLTALVLVVIFPSIRQVNVEGVSAKGIILSQVRSFFFIPLCISSAIGFFTFDYAGKRSLSRCLRRICLVCGAVMLLFAIYICCCLAVFTTLPPLTPMIGIYLQENQWIICAWWSIAVILLTLPAPRNAGNTGGNTETISA